MFFRRCFSLVANNLTRVWHGNCGRAAHRLDSRIRSPIAQTAVLVDVH